MAGWSLPRGARLHRAPALDATDRKPSHVPASTPGTTGGLKPGKPQDETPRRATSETSMRRLFETHYAAIWRLLRRLGIPSAQLDDAAQQVFWVAAQKLTEIHPGSEHAFLYGVAVRTASQEHRRRRATPQIVEIDELARLCDLHPSPEEQLEQRRARALLDVVLDRMPVELRSVFVLCELEELEVRQAAALEEIPVGTASSRLRRAREEFSAIAKRVRATLIARGNLR
jgi:RNA polymerase sigma-70 factor, ECF subfamily